MTGSDTFELECLPVSEAATLLHVVPKTIYRLVDRGELPAVRVGRSVRIMRSDLIAYLRGGETR